MHCASRGAAKRALKQYNLLQENYRKLIFYDNSHITPEKTRMRSPSLIHFALTKGSLLRNNLFFTPFFFYSGSIHHSPSRSNIGVWSQWSLGEKVIRSGIAGGAPLSGAVPARFYALQQGCQMAKFDPFLSLDCARVEGVGHNSSEGRDQILQRSVAEP